MGGNPMHPFNATVANRNYKIDIPVTNIEYRQSLYTFMGLGSCLMMILDEDTSELPFTKFLKPVQQQRISRSTKGSLLKLFNLFMDHNRDSQSSQLRVCSASH